MDGSEKCPYGYSPLHTAVIFKNLNAVQALTTPPTGSVRCDLDSRDSMGFTALHLATLQGSKELVDMLVQAGCDVNSGTKEGMTSLHICSERIGTEGILFSLVSESCDVNARNKLGRTALHLAAKQGNTENLRRLLDAGCDRNIKDKLGYTSLGLAYKSNQRGSAEILLHYKPKPNRWSSKESGLDENRENGSVKRVDRKAKLLSDTKVCSAVNASSKALNNAASLKLKKRQSSFHKLCNETIMKLAERMTKGKAPSSFYIYCLMLVMLAIKRNKLDGLTKSRRTSYFETFFERRMLTLALGPTLLSSSILVSVRSVTTLDARIGRLCLCKLNRRVLEGRDSHTLAFNLLLELLRSLKNSLVCSRIVSASIPLQRQSFSRSLINSKLLEKGGRKSDLVDFKAVTEMLTKVCNTSWRDEVTLQKITDADVDKNRELNEDLSTFDSREGKDISRDEKSNLVASYKMEHYLWFLDHMISMNSTPKTFAEDLLEFYLQNSSTFIRCLNYRNSMFSSMLNRCLSGNIWTSDKIARLFLQVCVALSTEQWLLFKCAGAVMEHSFKHQHCDAVSLGTCILVRMGLLKGEYDINTVVHLKGPLLALGHVFTADYFPRHLAAIFASFLCKSSPKLFGLDQLRLRALASAVTKEVLPTSCQEAESDAGKSFKRICDIMAIEEDWELLLECVDTLFSNIFGRLKCSVLRISESILIYLGLLKSEFCIENVRNLKCALKLVHHMMKQNYSSPELRSVFSCFLQKSNPSLYSCSEEVDAILRTLHTNKAGL